MHCKIPEKISVAEFEAFPQNQSFNIIVYITSYVIPWNIQATTYSVYFMNQLLLPILYKPQSNPSISIPLQNPTILR